jgi:hypothetical protein
VTSQTRNGRLAQARLTHASLFTAWLVGLAVLRAQPGSSLAGRVVDQTGLPLPGVTVELRQNEPSNVTVAVTDADGRYRFEGVTTGSVQVTFRLLNFAVIRRDVTVAADPQVPVDAVLPLSLTADVTVTGPRTFRNLADLENPAENVVGVAVAASQGAITAEQLEVRPVLRSGEVLETVPGVVISQHSGEGKANQYYLRGFNLDHGTDFATTVAGVPVNMPTHGHGHGYSDTNFLIPELVSGVQFKKGPYYADEGDFSAAGAANILYVNYLDRPTVRLAGGTQGWGRFLAAGSPRVVGGHLLGAIELGHNDGPWVRPDDYRKINGVVRYSRGDTHNGLALTGMAYAAEWNSTDQVPERAIASGLMSRFGNIDPSNGGRTHRHSVSADLQRTRERTLTRATAFAIDYGLNLFSNFTYFLDDPVAGDQFEQVDRRVVTGGRLTHRRLTRWSGRAVETGFGAQVRHDAIGAVALYKTQGRRRLSTIRDDEVGQTSLGGFAQADVAWSPTFRTLVGLRGDVYRFAVDADNPRNSGSEVDAVASPKLSATVGPWSGTELYVNAGLGFHSNDGRGATIREDPETREPADRVTPLVRAYGAEIGVRTIRFSGIQSAASLWVLGLESELLFVGDAGTTEASRPSRRYGIEWSSYIKLAPGVVVDADISISRARFTDEDPAGRRVPGAVERVVAAGVTVQPAGRLRGSARLRHFGPRALVEDDRVRSESTTLMNGEVGYRLTGRLSLMLDVFNLLDARVNDIDYFYTSRLPGEPLAGVDDIHGHPALPRAARLSLQVTF